MRKQVISFAVVASMLAAGAIGFAHEADEDLPAGPIRDRHELMEGIGKNAKAIGDALKAGKTDPIGPAAEAIQKDSGKVLALFPKGSTDPKSRAKAEIWDHWDKFESLTKDMGTKAGELAAAARSGGNVGAAADAMFGKCKACHDDFRKPEEKKGAKS
jgi:cytochrome c556